MAIINRSDFRHNFLKRVILRLDFQGVFESEMEKVLIQIKPFAKEHGFSKYLEKSTSEINIAVMDAGDSDADKAKNNVKHQKIYSFADEDRGIVLDVSNSFICLAINSTHYIPFDTYSGIIPFIANIYKENIVFFTVTRFGIRKINECLIRDKAQIQQFFNPLYFSYFDQLDGINTVQSNHTNIFTYGNYHINLLTNIAQGQLEKETVFSVRLDIDAYLTNGKNIWTLMENTENQSEINDLIFNIYTASLTDSFISLLTSDDEFDNALVIGVERND